MQPEVSQIVPPDIRIAMCETVAACHACEDLQLAVWGGSERELVPYDILRAIVHAGGTVLGAWDGERMVGIALSFVAWGASGAYHHSHLLGVLPDYRRWGIGWRLKMAQRAFILAQGLDLLTWTFDPLESANAHLNFAKLGVISQTYLPDFYGAMPEALNAGLPSDRLLVEWHLRSPHALARLAAAEMDASAIPLVSADAQDAPFLLRMSADRAPESTPHSLMTPETGIVRFRIEIPADIQAIKSAMLTHAQAWRRETRAVFTDAFAQGFCAVDYRAPRFHRLECGYYLLRRE